MTLVTFQDGRVVMRDGKVGTEQACCCNPCCCNSITLNDLLYGNNEYSWPSIKPPGKREPENGVAGNPPPGPASHCTDPKQANDADTLNACCNETSPGVYEWTCSGGWEIRPACLRWLCRCVDGEGNVRCSQTYGGPTVNDADLTELALNKFGAEATAGCYVYTFEFFGWRKKHIAGGAGWAGRDDLYTAYKTEATC